MTGEQSRKSGRGLGAEYWAPSIPIGRKSEKVVDGEDEDEEDPVSASWFSGTISSVAAAVSQQPVAMPLAPSGLSSR